MIDEEYRQLFEFQGRMLDVLHEGGSAEELLSKLRQAAIGSGLESYVATFDAKMVMVAAELVRKWGRR